MNPQVGTWTITVKSPTGPQRFSLRLEDGPRGFVLNEGGEDEVLPIEFTDDGGVTFENDTLKPMKLHMRWNLLVEGDEITGTVKPGVFPAQRVSGIRA